jgi:phosphoglycolate phosphatase-like HAD superfamily hydrolase
MSNLPIRFFMIGALTFLTGAASLQAAPPTSSKGDKPVIVTARDMLIREGSSVTLEAKLERKGFGFAMASVSVQGIWRGDIEGRELVFTLDGQPVGSSITDKEGFAQVTWTPKKAGDYLFEARFRGDEKYASGTDSLLVSVRPRNTEIVVLDIDHTLSHTSKKNVIKGRIDDLPLDHAKEVVARLHQGGQTLVYVSARMNKFNDVTRRWLAHWGFPRLPTYFLDIKRFPTYNEAKYKIATLSRIKQSFPNMVLGVGDKKSDAEAYRFVGMRALILGDAEGVEGAEVVESWKQVEEMLYSNRKSLFNKLEK